MIDDETKANLLTYFSRQRVWLELLSGELHARRSLSGECEILAILGIHDEAAPRDEERVVPQRLPNHESAFGLTVGKLRRIRETEREAKLRKKRVRKPRVVPASDR